MSEDKQKKEGKKVKSIKCNFHFLLLQNTRFENFHLPLQTTCQFISNYLYLDPPRQVKLEYEFNLSAHTVVDWSNFIKEAILLWCINYGTRKIGGPGKVVEIDEAKFGKRKCHQGRLKGIG